MKRIWRIGTWKPVGLVIAAAMLLFHPLGTLGYAFSPEQAEEVIDLIGELHVSAPPEEQLNDESIDGILKKLDDPYTAFYEEEEWSELFNVFEQVMVGIGIQYAATEEGLQIIKVYEDSAAELYGLNAGEIIVGVEDTMVAGLSDEELRSRLLGPEDSVVSLKVMEPSNRVIRTVKLIRRPFHIPSVEYGIMAGGAGYIRIDSFSSDTAELVEKALDFFRRNESSLAGLILDLRGNPGGYLDAVSQVAANFIKEGPLLYTVGRDKKLEPVTIKNGSGIEMPMVMLVDGGSASASEVFAGAMKDYGLATLVGVRTFGKGSVQQLIPLKSGGGLRVTVEYYLTPNRNEVNEVGIQPDIVEAFPLLQTMTAARLAGVKEFTVEFKPYETVVGGVPFGHTAWTIREGERVFVHSRALAAAIGSQAEWNETDRTIAIQGQGRNERFSEHDGLKLEGGAGFIDVNRFAQAFPGVKVNVSAKSVVLELRDDG